jgi:hypothetical protein
LVRPLQGICEDVVYTGHWLVFPRTRRYARSMVLFLGWLARELRLDVNLDELEAPARKHATDPGQLPAARP